MARGGNTAAALTGLTEAATAGRRTRKRQPQRVGKRQHVSLADGRQVGYIKWPGRGTPVVLIHGLLDSAEGFDEFCRDTNRPCFCFDIPGFGSSDRPHAAKISSYAADMIEAIDAAGIERFILLGHSLGGAIASEIASAEAERINALILLAPAGYGRLRLAEVANLPGISEGIAVTAGKVIASDTLVGLGYRRFVSNGISPSRQLLGRTTRDAVRCIPGMRLAIRALARSGKGDQCLSKRKDFYTGPVTALWGSDDALVPLSHIKGLEEALPQARVEIWEGMGHHPQAERPVELAALIEQACRRRPARAARAASTAAAPIAPIAPTPAAQTA